MNKMNDYQPDTLMKDFWRITDHFLDLCNGTIFHGKTVITAAVEIDSEEGTTTPDKSIQRNRDLIKMTKVHDKDVIIGIENQQKKDKTMPIRDMEYTILKYSIRLKDSQNKICPIITIVIHYGCGAWDKEMKLNEMMDIPEEIEEYYNDWKTIIIDAKEVDVSLFKNKDVRDFFEGLQNLYSWNKDIRTLKGLGLTYETALAIGVVTGTQALIEKAEQERGGMINMCQAVDEALAEREMKGRIEGIKEGEVKGEKRGEIRGKIETMIKNLQKMMNKLEINLEEAMDILDIPVNEREIYKEKFYS